MSCIESSGGRFSIFRNRSLTLFKNERDFKEKFDSVAVSESISISITNSLDTGFTVLVFDISAETQLRKSLFVSIPFWVVSWASAHYRSHRSCLLLVPRAQRYLTFISGFHQAFWCSRGKHVRIPCAASRDQIHHRLRFYCDSFFTWFFLRSFRHHFKTIGTTEMANVKQTQKMIPFIMCEISFGQYVCELVLVSMCLIWILGSRLILSNNQSRATLWVLETCLIVGLLPFQIILITASLSSNTYNKASWREELTFEETKSTLSRSSIIPWDFFRFWSLWGVARTSRRFVHRSHSSWLFWYVFPWKLWRSDPINQVRENRPTSILHPRKWFLILLNCARLKFVSYTSNWWEQCMTSRMHNFPPDVDFESSRSPAKSESWNSLNLHCLAVFPTWQYCVYSLVWWM